MNAIPFQYTPYAPEGDVTVKRQNLNGSVVGIDYHSAERQISVDVCCIVQYEHGETTEAKETLVIREAETFHIDGETLGTMFYDHYMYGRIMYMEFFIIPTGCYPIKWRIKVEE